MTAGRDRPAAAAARQRSAVLALLDELDGFRSAQDLHALLRERGDSVGLATVYRALQALVDDGEVDVLRSADGEAVYRRCSPSHHHHLVCRSCGARWRSPTRRSSAGPHRMAAETVSPTSSTRWRSSAPAPTAPRPP